MGISYVPTLAQVLARGNTQDGDIVPDAANTRSLGTALLYYKELFAKKITMHGPGTIDGGTNLYLVGTQLTHYIGAVPKSQFSATGLIVGGDITPQAGTGNIGSITSPWLNLYLSGSIFSEIENYGHLEVFEHFNKSGIYSYLDPLGYTHYSDNIIFDLATASASISNLNTSELSINTGPITGNHWTLYGKGYHNPADYTYYSHILKFKLNAITIQNSYIMSIFDDTGNYMAYVTLGTNAGTISFNTTGDGGANTTTTDNISLDITADTILKIDIKSGTIRLSKYSGGAWSVIATHTTDVFYNAPLGIYPLIYIETSTDAAKTMDLDYLTVQLGRAF